MTKKKTPQVVEAPVTTPSENVELEKQTVISIQVDTEGKLHVQFHPSPIIGITGNPENIQSWQFIGLLQTALDLVKNRTFQ